MTVAEKSQGVTIAEEEQFYSAYGWCLNPALTLRELFQRFQEEILRTDNRTAAWQREECKINLYLFACAIACTTDDWLAPRMVNFARIAARFPPLKIPVDVAQQVLARALVVGRAFQYRSVTRWRRQWTDCVDQTCQILIQDAAEAGVDQEALSRLRALSQDLPTTRLPESLLSKRMFLPEAFRCQDMTHHDVMALAQRFVKSSPDKSKPIAVIGVRTAGAYFAPFVKAYLADQGMASVSWFTIRPKGVLAYGERLRLGDVIRQDARVLLVDDYQNTGQTYIRTLALLRRFGIGPERVAILMPRHPARPKFSVPTEIEGAEQYALITLDHAELYKAQLINLDCIESLGRDYYEGHAGLKARVVQDDRVDRINADFSRHYSDGFQVRLKTVAAIELSGADQPPVVKRVFAKSVGWGWLGYHAYISGTRLAGVVPKVLGLRHGFLFMEWLEHENSALDILKEPARLQTVPSYVAARARHLRLPEDTCLDHSNYRWSGGDQLADLLSRVYGRYSRRFKIPVLYRRLREFPGVASSLTDGKMELQEWIQTKAGLYKTDFEQHNFGGGELNIVDPAYDLASAVFEFKLSQESEREVLDRYVKESGDRSIAHRFLLYKLLYGTVVKIRAAYNIALHDKMEGHHGGRTWEDWQARHLAAHNFLIYQMNRCCGGLIAPMQASWSKSLFFLDLDDVFDHPMMGFPHTTWSGLQALDLLRSYGISTVINTGRSVDHVRDYCRNYGIPGGLAEFGSVFVDAVNGTEQALIDPESADPLDRCREALQKLDGVVIDPGYRYSVRAYRYDGRVMSCLRQEEVEGVFARARSDKLSIISTAADTYIVQRGVSKGSGARAVKKALGCGIEPASAIGNSDPDLEMLQEVEFPYAPANCSEVLRRRAGKKGKLQVMGRPFQRGLLAAVQDLIQSRLQVAKARKLAACPQQSADGLIAALLQAADRSPLGQLVSLLNWRGL